MGLEALVINQRTGRGRIRAVWPSNQRCSGFEVGFNIGAIEDRSEDRSEDRDSASGAELWLERGPDIVGKEALRMRHL